MVKRVKLSADVERALANRAVDLDSILRNALGLSAKSMTTPEGTELPEGTDFLAWYGPAGRPFWGKLKDGQIEMFGERFPTVSAAAAKITGRPTTNGWEFWQVKLPGQTRFVPIMELRKPGAERFVREVHAA